MSVLAEIGRRFVRSERWVALVRFLAELDRTDRPAPPPNPDTQLRPIERRLLRWRADGANHQELSDKFRRSADLLARIEDYANYKLAAS